MIELEHVSKRYGTAAPAVDDLTLRVPEGAFLALVGPSGCGKSTTLRMINRLVARSSGQIRVGGRSVDTVPEAELRRGIGYVVQSGGLFPHWTVERNIATVPALLGWPRARQRERVTELLHLLQLDPGRYRGAYPHELSGGQQQRVGVARALAADPPVLLLDEPFGALDPLTRRALQDELARIHRQTGKTVVMVTHDMDEALRLADSVAIMKRGRLVQHGSPTELLSQPAEGLAQRLLGSGERGLRLLALSRVADRMRPADPAAAVVDTVSDTTPSTAPIGADADLREALSEMVARRVDRLPVVRDGAPAGTIHLADLLRP